MANEKLKFLMNNYSKFSPSKKAYIKRVLTSMRRKSQNWQKGKSEEMIDEWSFTNSEFNVREMDRYTKCELCGQPENIFQFRIQNELTGQSIWTGSVCITNFSIPVYDSEGKRIEKEKDIEDIFKDNVKDIKEQKRLDLLKSLINDINTMGKEQGFENEYKLTQENEEDGVFTLKQLKMISAMYLKVYNDFISEDYINLFKVNMRLKRNKEELLKLEPFHWCQFYPIFGKYIFIKKNGFTDEVRQKAMNIISYYRPEYLDNFLKKVG
jgi:hypothetical protein